MRTINFQIKNMNAKMRLNPLNPEIPCREPRGCGWEWAGGTVAHEMLQMERCGERHSGARFENRSFGFWTKIYLGGVLHENARSFSIKEIILSISVGKCCAQLIADISKNRENTLLTK